MTQQEHADPKLTQADRQRSYHQRQLERGMVRLSVYVPAKGRDEFWAAVDRLRVRWEAQGLLD